MKAGTKTKVGDLKRMLPQGGLGECFEGEAIGDSTTATILKLRKLEAVVENLKVKADNERLSNKGGINCQGVRV